MQIFFCVTLSLSPCWTPTNKCTYQTIEPTWTRDSGSENIIYLTSSSSYRRSDWTSLCFSDYDQMIKIKQGLSDKLMILLMMMYKTSIYSSSKKSGVWLSQGGVSVDCWQEAYKLFALISSPISCSHSEMIWDLAGASTKLRTINIRVLTRMWTLSCVMSALSGVTKQ